MLTNLFYLQCFSFGTFWNTGCYTLDIYVIDPDEEPEEPHSWAYLETKQEKLPEESHKPAPESSTNGTHNQPNITTVPRVKLESSADFEKLVRASQPAVIEGLNLGPCVEKWTPEYLVDSVGADRMVSFSCDILTSFCPPPYPSLFGLPLSLPLSSTKIQKS